MRTLIVLILVLAAAGPSVALAQENPFGGLPPTQPDPSTQTTPSSTAPRSTGGGLARWQEVAMVLAGAALIAGIGLAIVRDARRKAPVTEGEIAGAHTSSAAGARKTHNKAKARKKAKAAKAARRHNR